jgi:hypothetical protein
MLPMATTILPLLEFQATEFIHSLSSTSLFLFRHSLTHHLEHFNSSSLIATLLNDIKTAYQQKHNLPSTYDKMEQKPIKLVKNDAYVRSGRKSLGHLVRKCMCFSCP